MESQGLKAEKPSYPCDGWVDPEDIWLVKQVSLRRANTAQFLSHEASEIVKGIEIDNRTVVTRGGVWGAGELCPMGANLHLYTRIKFQRQCLQITMRSCAFDNLLTGSISR